jgi:nucleotide-binding universal stress UspA family protein
MKLKAGRRAGRLVLETGKGEFALPPIALPELRLKRILLPVDFSEASRKALHYAVSFAKQFNSEVLLLHVVEVVPMEGQSVATELHEAAAKQLSEWRKEIVSHTSVKAVIRDGISAHQVIVEAVHENSVDLIVLGTQGRTGLAHPLIGSTAERVVRHAPCPVLVVREREHDFLARPGETKLAKTTKTNERL